MKCKKCKREVTCLQLNGFCGSCIEPKNLEKVKKRIKERDNYTCQECGKKEGSRIPKEELLRLPLGEAKRVSIEVHHIKPLYLGGRDELENLTTLCYRCHKLKHSKR